MNLFTKPGSFAGKNELHTRALVLERCVRTIYDELPAVVLTLFLVGWLAHDVESTAVVERQNGELLQSKPSVSIGTNCAVDSIGRIAPNPRLKRCARFVFDGKFYRQYA